MVEDLRQRLLTVVCLCKCADDDRAVLIILLMSFACWLTLEPMSMLATQRCGRRCMLLPHVATWGFAAISANSQLISLLIFFLLHNMYSIWRLCYFVCYDLVFCIVLCCFEMSEMVVQQSVVVCNLEILTKPVLLHSLLL